MILYNQNEYRDETPFREISPLRSANYLRAQGWQEQRQDDYFEILLPLRPDFCDFARRMAELFNTLEQAEQRDRNDILDSLALTGPT